MKHDTLKQIYGAAYRDANSSLEFASGLLDYLEEQVPHDDRAIDRTHDWIHRCKAELYRIETLMDQYCDDDDIEQ